MKVALLHDWLFHMRGGEKVLEEFARLYPDATIYTFFSRKKNLSAVLRAMKIRTSFLSRLPFVERYYRWLFPLLPFVARTMKIEPVDLVLSSSHCAAKAVPVPPGALHICYCHTPARYLWGFEDVYFRSYPAWARKLIEIILEKLRRWDCRTNANVHFFISNSENVRQRIQRIYRRDSAVIHPPVDAAFFRPQARAKNYYLCVSAFVPYKRTDLVIEAFNGWDRRLLIAGTGPLERRYRRQRKSSNISFLGRVPGDTLRTLFAEARALIFPTEEDFGIIPVEAQACGTPVVAYEAGGALEGVKHGVFFREQTAEAIRRAVIELESKSFDRAEVSRAVFPFDKRFFGEKIQKFVEDKINARLSP